MANVNCLEGIQCPECGSEEPFYIGFVGMLKAYDDGTEDYSDHEWDDDSPINCVMCGHAGKVGDFHVEEDEEEDEEEPCSQ